MGLKGRDMPSLFPIRHRKPSDTSAAMARCRPSGPPAKLKHIPSLVDELAAARWAGPRGECCPHAGARLDAGNRQRMRHVSLVVGARLV